VFARLGGGIYTKAGRRRRRPGRKIEAGHPRRTIRATRRCIADNVGRQRRRLRGMAADLFETYAVTAVAVMLLGTQFPSASLALYPLALGGISILAS
jgi:K(+)-stimulated pyrophosphate-energized sodium pump